jgi:hypothetical protein
MIALTRHDSTFTTTVNVPNNAKTGTIAMRLRVNFKQQIQGCDYDVKGEIEDYAITIEGATTPCDNDNQAPTLLCPNNIVVTDSSQIGNWQTPIFSDNCEKTADIVLESNFVKGSKFPLGTSRVIYTATDRLCNATNCSFNVTVNSIINAANERPSFPIRVFPNPTVGAVFIEFESPQIQTVSFRFSNTIGQTVFSETRLIERGINRLQFDVSKLRQGVYFCTISDNKLILSIGKLFVAN